MSPLRPSAPSPIEPQGDAGADPRLPLLFLAGGAAALIYELAWFQWLQLILGLTSVSIGLILGTFMGGMGLGSLLLPRSIPVRRHPLRVVAMLEVGIAIWAGALLLLGPGLASAYSRLAGPGALGATVRGGLAALCLIPPTVMMGATLPLVSRCLGDKGTRASRVGFLYACNTAGAVLGCLLGGFYLLRLHDLVVATGAGMLINLAAAGLAWSAAHQIPTSPEANPCDTASVNRPAVPGARDALWVAGLSGASALGAEVVWTRLLGLVLGGTVYTFSLLLAVLLAGLGLGSGMASCWSLTHRNPRLAMTWIQLGLVMGIVWAVWMIPESLPHWPINPAISLSPWYTFQLDLLRAAWAVLPAAFCWGASLPVALAVFGWEAGAGTADAARRVGQVYAANTLGSILGALGFSLGVVPWLGSRGAERLLIALSILAAGLSIHAVRRRGTPPLGSWRSRGLMGGVALLGLAAVIRVPETPWGLAAYGRFLATYGPRLDPQVRPENETSFTNLAVDIHCTYLGEGINGSIAVTRLNSGTRNFHSAGKVQASNDPRDMRLQRMLGHLSALVHAKAESVLVVACGAGVTAGSFVPHPETRRIVICDIEPLVPARVAPQFSKENFNVIADPRTQVVSDDGRHFIRTTHESFDIITSDPIDPWVKGCAALNTVEYYRMCREHLRPGGVMSLWVPLYESDRDTVRTLMTSFFAVFPDATLWSNDEAGQGYDAVLLGQASPTRLDLTALQARYDRPEYLAVRRSLREAGFPTLLELMGTYAGNAADLEPWCRGAALNTDRNLRLQYLAGWSVNSFLSSRILDEIVAYRRYPVALFGSDESHRRQITDSWKSTPARNE